jgi:hypothetical protein
MSGISFTLSLKSVSYDAYPPVICRVASNVHPHKLGVRNLDPGNRLKRLHGIDD